MKYATFLLIIFLASASICFSQANVFFTNAKASLDSFSNQNPQEKTFLHIDRLVYVPNETIWLKIYCMTDGVPTYVSKVVYADLINESGVVQQKKMYYLKNGTAAGSIDIPSDLPTGKYLVRAYTLWMLNFPGFVQTKEINIYNNTKTDKNNTSKSPEVNIRFFPEGGNIIAEIPTKIAFKAMLQDESPVAMNGNIMNSAGNIVATFKTAHEGMGNFILDAKTGENYFATFAIDGTIKK